DLREAGRLAELVDVQRRISVRVALREGGHPHRHGAVPAPAVRAGDGHAQLPPGGTVPVAQRPYAPAPVRVHVRGPDRPAPGPVELSVLRV
ncbi:hypothetical protein AB0D15_13785, partial [Streptomyces sp. NPDC048551]